MAEALLRLIAGDHFEAESAGTHPAGLNPMTIESMQETGVDVRNYRSKNLDEFVGQPFDYVITVCDRAKESCPVFPGASNLRFVPTALQCDCSKVQLNPDPIA